MFLFLFPYRHNRIALVQYLLKDAHCDPNCTSKDGRTPLGMTDDPEISKHLIKYGAKATDVYKQYSKPLPCSCSKKPTESPVKTFIIGNQGVGKSTLAKALRMPSNVLSRVVNRWRQVPNVEQKTAGIEPYDIESDHFGHISLYDFAGHKEYYGSHGAFLRNATAVSSAALFILVSDLRESDKELSESILFWLHFIHVECTHTRSGPKPHIVIIGSRADQLESNDDLLHKKGVVSSLLQTHSSNLHYVGFVAMDCRYAGSSAMSQLHKHLANSCETLRNKVEVSFRGHCLFLYLFDKYHEVPAMTIGRIIADIIPQTTEAEQQSMSHHRAGEQTKSSTEQLLQFLPEDPQTLRELLEDLYKRGNILILKNIIEHARSWVILDQEALLSHVTGTVFAPEGMKEHRDLATNTGVVLLSKLQKYFPELDLDMLIQFLCHLEFCHEITDPEDLELLHASCSPASPNERFFLFPGLVNIEAPADVWATDDQFLYQSGWILQCSQPNEFFTPRFLHILLLKLAFSFALSLEKQVDHPALQRKCSVWKNGIYWASRDGVECLVEVATPKQVHAMVRCLKGSEIDCVHLRSLVIRNILAILKQLYQDISTSEMIIHPSSVTYPFKLDDKPTVYSLHEVATAVCKAKLSVVNENRKLATLDQLLCFEPYAHLGERILHELFSEEKPHCDKEVADEFLYRIADQVHEKKEKFVKLFKPPATMLHERIQEAPPGLTHEIARVFQLWRDRSEGTYQCLRKELDQFSVFGGRNPLSC